jgi:hypothetical protein
MQAPDLATLQLIQPEVDLALQPRLDPILQAFTQRQADDLPGNRVDIMMTVGQWTGRWGVRTNGILAHSAWRYNLTLAVSTKRAAADDPPAADIHGPAVAQIRAACIAAAADPAFLRYHTLVELNEQIGTERVVTEDDLDCSAIVFTGQVVIREDAWPYEV